LLLLPNMCAGTPA